MVAIAGITAVAAVMVFLEVPSLWKKGQIRELWSFSLLLLAGTGIGMAQSLHVPIPNPIDWIDHLYRPIGLFIENALKLNG